MALDLCLICNIIFLFIRIPLSLRTRGIEIDVAKREFEEYVKLLRELDLDVIEMPQDEDLPESVFIEDTAVVCNNIALITKPANASRLKEVSLWVSGRLSFPDWNLFMLKCHFR